MTLTLLFAGLGGIAMTLLYAYSPELSNWWRLPLWIGFYVAFALLFLILAFSFFLLLPKKNPSPRIKHISHRLIKLILRWVLLLLGVRITVTGTEKLPDRPYLWVSNHLSAFDPLCTAAALNQEDIVFVAKPSIFKIPVIGAAMTRLCFLPIDRENARNAVTTIKRAAELIRDVGLAVAIYPEGTRSKTGALLPFHAGSFKIAAMAKCPVAVASIRMKKGWLKLPSRVEIRVLDVMDADYVTANNTATLAARAEQTVREDLGQ